LAEVVTANGNPTAVADALDTLPGAGLVALTGALGFIAAPSI
jgi:hypothetical protein